MAFSYDPPQDVARYQAVLDRLFPPNEHVSHLRFVWEPGEEWDELGRWYVYQMVPAVGIPLIMLPWLEGPDPRQFVRYDKVRRQVYYLKGAPLISRRQWQLYRETGFLAMPYWIVQGERGGHKLQFSKVERVIAKVKGRRETPPPPGSLSYAPIDERVITKLAQMDAMRTYNLLLDFAMRNPDMLDAEEERGANEAKDRLWSWMEDQVGGIVDMLPNKVVSRIAGLDDPIQVFT